MLEVPGYDILQPVAGPQGVSLLRGQRRADGQPVVRKIPRTNNERDGATELVREYRLLRNLHSDRIVRALALEQSLNGPALVLEHFDRVVATELLEGPLPSRSVLEIGTALALALRDVHDAGVIHKDVRPASIAIDRSPGTARLFNFGLSVSATTENDLYHPGLLAGGLPYISPEQTGRIGRETDFRSDLYSLGATLYEMLTGAPPFVSDDPLELVHLHLAQTPLAPHRLNRAIPRSLSAIVMKLLEKPPEKRYQTAQGLHADLLEIERQIVLNAPFVEFQLGEREASNKLRIPDRLYGRSNEMDTLRKTLDRARRETSSFVLLIGPAGVGKSVIAQWLEADVVEMEGFFASADLEPATRASPFTAFAQSAASIVRQLLTRSDAQLDDWRAQARPELTACAPVLVELVPNLDRVLEAAAYAVPTASVSHEAGLVELFRSLASPDHPVILFLDGLARADGQNLRLVEQLLHRVPRGLLIIGAYREEDSAAESPVANWRASQRESEWYSEVRVEPLARSDITALVSETLGRPPGELRELVELVTDRTLGNPFAIRHTLLHWQSVGLIRHDSEQGWTFDVEAIRRTSSERSVVSLIMAEIARLPGPSREVLKIASSLGGRFDLGTLVGVSDAKGQLTVEGLYHLIAEGLICPDSDGYRFAHDGVRECSATLLSESERTRYRLRVGRLRLCGSPPEDLDRNLFEIVDHLNAGAASIESETERERLIELNLMAAQRAILARSYEIAGSYANAGLALVDGVRTSPQNTFGLRFAAAHAAELVGEKDLARRDFEALLDENLSREDRGRITARLVELYCGSNETGRAIEIGLAALDNLGLSLPRKPKPRDIAATRREAIATWTAFIPSRLEEDKLPDPLRIARSDLQGALLAAAAKDDPPLACLLAAVRAKEAHDGGIARNAAEAIVWFAATALPRSGLAPLAQLASHLNEQSPPRERVATEFILHAHVVPALSGSHRSLEPLLGVARQAAEAGDARTGVLALLYRLWIMLMIGRPLAQVESQAREAIVFTARFGDASAQRFAGWVEGLCRTVRSLRDTGDSLPALDDLAPGNEEARVAQTLAAAQIACIYGRPADAHSLTRTLDAQQRPLFKVPFEPYYHALRGISAAMLASRDGRPFDDGLWTEVRDARRHLKSWARIAPMNYAHLYWLLEAELYAGRSESEAALGAFATAAARAHENGLPHHSALIASRRADFARRLGHAEDASALAERAEAHRLAWTGAPVLVTAAAQSRLSGLDYSPREPVARWFASQHSLDLETVFRSSQAISRETQLQGVLERVMASLIENAGAQRGAMLLLRDGRLNVVIEGAIGKPPARLSVPLEEHSGRLPVSVVKYVQRTSETVVIGDAAEAGLFSHDSYVVATRTKSVLCMPILSQSKLVGVVYLENALVADAFTEERLQVLRLLSAQAAISIENASLYDELREARHDLEIRVAERTKELREANNRLRREVDERKRAQHELEEVHGELVMAARRAGMAEVATGVLHNVGNVLNSVNVATTVLTERVRNSRLAGLERAVSLLREHATDLDRFVREDQRGPKLLEYLSQLSSHLLKEHATMSAELSQIARNINHIREIVSAQQTFAGVGGVAETLSAADLVGEAIRICGASRPWKGQTTEFSCFGVGEVTVDKHKILQILVNLISNARESMDSNPSSDGVVKVTVQSLGETRFAISVADSGVGIDREHSAKIFTHGFTTKKNGHGFGLHSSANAAREIGGSLRVESEGRGRGATFVLEVPLHATGSKKPPRTPRTETNANA